MNEQQVERLAALIGLATFFCVATVFYFDVPRLYQIDRYGPGIIDGGILLFAIVRGAIGFRIRKTASAALAGSIIGLALGMMLFSGNPDVRE